MRNVDDQGRPEPPLAGDEVATLLGFLDFQRATLEWKCRGLDAVGLAARLAPSTMTLGGILKHMAWVEDHWFSCRLLGNEPASVWRGVDWDADRDWEWNSARNDAPDVVRRLWKDSVATSREIVAAVLDAQGHDTQGADAPGPSALRPSALGPSALGLDTLSATRGDDTRAPSLRWIVCHMIEEYARHNGHADLLREAVDGAVGE